MKFYLNDLLASFQEQSVTQCIEGQDIEMYYGDRKYDGIQAVIDILTGKFDVRESNAERILTNVQYTISGVTIITTPQFNWNAPFGPDKKGTKLLTVSNLNFSVLVDNLTSKTNFTDICEKILEGKCDINDHRECVQFLVTDYNDKIQYLRKISPMIMIRNDNGEVFVYDEELSTESNMIYNNDESYGKSLILCKIPDDEKKIYSHRVCVIFKH